MQNIHRADLNSQNYFQQICMDEWILYQPYLFETGGQLLIELICWKNIKISTTFNAAFTVSASEAEESFKRMTLG